MILKCDDKCYAGGGGGGCEGGRGIVFFLLFWEGSSIWTLCNLSLIVAMIDDEWCGYINGKSK